MRAPTQFVHAIVAPVCSGVTAGAATVHVVVARLVSPALIGLHAATVQVEADLRGGNQPSFAVVGLPDTAVQEARERVRSGLANQALAMPRERIVVNLAPADLRKVGPQYDLPIALAVLAASGTVPRSALVGLGAAGELALDGTLRPLHGTLAMAEHAASRGWRRMMVPAGNGAEAALVPGIEVVPVRGLRHAVDVLTGAAAFDVPDIDPRAILDATDPGRRPDLAEVRGQGPARRAMEIAAAGDHSILMMGPPGGGKTMLARRLPAILPALDVADAITVTRIHSVAGLLPAGTTMLTARPFRAPHHTISAVGLIGGGRVPQPGEVTLAHGGVLFLDEVCAFSPAAIDALRQPLEAGFVDVTRGMTTARFPARPILVCAGNPCPCGFAGDADHPCRCPPGRVSAYMSRLSGPVLDRIDLRIVVPRLSADEVVGTVGAGESSATVRARVEAARRFAAADGRRGVNAAIASDEIHGACRLDDASRTLLTRAVDRHRLTARGHDRLLRVARTIADLAASEVVRSEHLLEALAYRMPSVTAHA